MVDSCLCISEQPSEESRIRLRMVQQGVWTTTQAFGSMQDREIRRREYFRAVAHIFTAAGRPARAGSRSACLNVQWCSWQVHFAVVVLVHRPCPHIRPCAAKRHGLHVAAPPDAGGFCMAAGIAWQLALHGVQIFNDRIVPCPMACMACMATPLSYLFAICDAMPYTPHFAQDWWDRA